MLTIVPVESETQIIHQLEKPHLELFKSTPEAADKSLSLSNDKSILPVRVFYHEL